MIVFLHLYTRVVCVCVCVCNCACVVCHGSFQTNTKAPTMELVQLFIIWF